MSAVWIEPDPAPLEAGRRIERETHKLEKRLCRQVGQAIVDYNMIEEGDKVMVCVSGGKDSYALLDILLKLQRARADPLRHRRGQPRPEAARLSRSTCCPSYLKALGVPFHIEEQDTYCIVKRVIPEGKTTCGLCSRLRRGILYRVADELGATKVALGHHRDDMLQTFFLNMFFGGKLKGMPPKLVSDDGRHIVIRPLAYVAEKDLVRWAAAPRVPDHSLHPVRQPGEPAAQAGRRDAARMGAQVSRAASRTCSARCRTSCPRTCSTERCYDFKGLKATGVADADGDKAFDRARVPGAAARCRGVQVDQALRRACLASGDSSCVASLSCWSRRCRRLSRLRHQLGGRQRGARLLAAGRRAGQRRPTASSACRRSRPTRPQQQQLEGDGRRRRSGAGLRRDDAAPRYSVQ